MRSHQASTRAELRFESLSVLFGRAKRACAVSRAINQARLSTIRTLAHCRCLSDDSCSCHCETQSVVAIKATAALRYAGFLRRNDVAPLNDKWVGHPHPIPNLPQLRQSRNITCALRKFHARFACISLHEVQYRCAKALCRRHYIRSSLSTTDLLRFSS